MKNSTRLFGFLLVIVIFLGACNIPTGTPDGEGASLTAAAQTVEAQFLTLTQQAQILVTPSFTSIPGQVFTLTPPPTLTVPASATPTCDLGKFISDVSIPDGTVMLPGQAFTKTWRLQNIGACTWAGYSLVFDSGDAMGGPASKAIETTPSNGTVDVSVNLTAPATPGNYRGYWRVRSASGVLLPMVNGYQGKSFYVDIKVQNPTPTPTKTSVPFAVTSVSFVLGTWNDAGHTNCPRVTANITTNGPGTVTYHWTRSDNPTIPTETLTFASAGTQAVNYDWALGSVWAGTNHWVGLYIDSPNHQDFGHIEFTTACTSP